MKDRLAIFGGRKTIGEPIPTWPQIGDSEKHAVADLLNRNKLWMGEKVEELQREFADFQDAACAVACANGTVALEMALVAAGIAAGDEVIVPAYTFAATATAVLRVNAVPVFADIEADTLNLDTAALERQLTPRTRAIIPVHFCGHACDMDAISALAGKHNLMIIEDAAQSWGAKWRNKGLGAWGDAGIFSFQETKNLTAGEGGILLTNDDEVAERAWSYHNCGRARDGQWYGYPYFGTNIRMTEIQATMILEQLKRLPADMERREKAARKLDRQLAEIPGFKVPKRDSRVTSRSWHLYDFFFDSDEWRGVRRDQVLEALNAEGLPVSGGYARPLYREKLFQDIAAGTLRSPFVDYERMKSAQNYASLELPHAESACKTALWLPHHLLLMPENRIDGIASALIKVWEGRSQLKD